MANTYSQMYVQIVFSVRGRECFIKESFREELQKYIAGIIANKNQKLYAIYCMPDHVHILISMTPDMRVADLVRDIKANSSRFIKEKNWVNSLFSWQTGYGAFSYQKERITKVVNYILTQQEHHRKKSFREEYLGLLKEFEINYDERYLFEFY